MAPTKNLRQKGIARIVLYVLLGIAMGTLALLVDHMLAAAFAFGLVVLYFGFLIFAPKQKREEGFIRLANLDPTAGSPKVSGTVVAVVLLSFLVFLVYVAFKHHI